VVLQAKTHMIDSPTSHDDVQGGHDFQNYSDDLDLESTSEAECFIEPEVSP